MALVLSGTDGVSGVDGTASNPAIEGTDSNTGIFYPAADTVAIGTGGTEALRVNSSQQLGLGVTSPAAKLDLNTGGASNTMARFTSNGSYYTYILSSGVTSVFSADTSGNNAIQIRGGSNQIEFNTNGSLRATLDSAGNLGLGVTPSAWGAPFQAFEGGDSNNQEYLAFQTNANAMKLGVNHFYNGSNYVYKFNGAASRYDVNDTSFIWNLAASGTAGNAITFTQAMTLDASGNLGVGTSSPNRKLVVDGGSSDAYLKLTTSATASNFASGILFNNTLNSDGNVFIRINGGESNLVFGTGASERARITSDGALWVGNTTRQSTSNHTFIQNVASDWTANFQCNTATAANNYGILINYNASSPNGTTNEFLICQDSTALRAEIRSNGGISNYTANNSPLSDRRLKTAIQPAGSYLEKICAIPVVTYLYKDQTDDLLNLGVIAQDVQTAAPELCNEEGWRTKAEDGTYYLGIWETDLHYAVMKAVQELKAIVDTQATRIEAQAAEIAALKGAA